MKIYAKNVLKTTLTILLAPHERELKDVLDGKDIMCFDALNAVNTYKEAARKLI